MRERSDRLVGRTASQHQPAAEAGEIVAERGQASMQPPSRGPAPPALLVVEKEKGNDGPARSGSPGERRIVGKPEVAPEPDEHRTVAALNSIRQSRRLLALLPPIAGNSGFDALHSRPRPTVPSPFPARPPAVLPVRQFARTATGPPPMPRTRRPLALAAALLALLPAFWMPAAAEPLSVTFVHVNDWDRMDGIDGRGGAAKIAAVVSEERARAEKDGGLAIVTFGGDMISPSLLSGLDMGRTHDRAGKRNRVRCRGAG